jgi:hypothetical protein
MAICCTDKSYVLSVRIVSSVTIVQDIHNDQYAINALNGLNAPDFCNDINDQNAPNAINAL